MLLAPGFINQPVAMASQEDRGAELGVSRQHVLEFLFPSRPISPKMGLSMHFLTPEERKA